MYNFRIKNTVHLFLVILFGMNCIKDVHSQNKYSYQILPNDPMKVRIYKLENGLTVYFSVYKNAPRIQALIGVKTGSKNDPSDCTGLSHYLEHLMFKGTIKFGTTNYTMEKPYLDKIDTLFEIYRSTKDSTERTSIYKKIDSISYIASHFALPGEYDKMMTSIGAKGINAYTQVDQTVFESDIPSNQLEKWMSIESDRFENPVIRLFHTELETVYEEKNRAMDNDVRKVREGMLEGLFKKHAYGTQTILGTVEHLKNPSILRIKNYINTYYVPNNMVICLSGDFDPDIAIALIDTYFGKLKPKNIPATIFPPEDSIKVPVVKEIYGPDAEMLLVAYRFNGANSKDADYVELVSRILSNNTAGIMDVNINQAQKALSSSNSPLYLKDYSVNYFQGKPKEGQSLEQLKELILEQVEILKAGDFQNWLLPAVINEIKLENIKLLQSNSLRAKAMLSSFTYEIPWENFVSKTTRLEKITKKDIIDFANTNYKKNYTVVYKRTGIDKTVRKMVKPKITPIFINRRDESAFFRKIIDTSVPDIEPVFVNYNTEILKLKVKNIIPLYYKENTEDEMFNLYYIIKVGTHHNKKIALAVEYLKYLGTSKLIPSKVKRDFYILGCTFDITVNGTEVRITLTGLDENLEKAVTLLEDILQDPFPDKQILNELINSVLKQRKDSKLSKNTILKDALYSYAIYGPKSPYTDVLSEKELKSIKPEELISIIKSLPYYEHYFMYYGPHNRHTLIDFLNKQHTCSNCFIPTPEPTEYTELPTDTNRVFVVDYNMKQVELMKISKMKLYNKKLIPSIRLYNDYFGIGLSSIVFQELRESKALAYTATCNITIPDKPTKSHIIQSFIGTQVDKLPEAMSGMTELMNTMPESQGKFNNAKEAILQQIRTERITKSNVLLNYENAMRLGLTYDIRIDLFSAISNFTLSDIRKFQQNYVKDKNFSVLVLGNKKNIDPKALEKYGEIKYLTLEELFGY